MATQNFTVAPDNTSASTFYNWAHRISAAFKAFGWKQTGDTGQLVWPVSIISITNAVAASGTVTFTYTLLQGAALRIGGQIVVTNCTTSGLNATYTIASLPLGNTFTAATATTVTEAETAFGGVNPQVSISNAIGNGSTNTYNYTVLDGTDPIPGQSIVLTANTTSGFNGTFTIGSVNTGAGTFVTTTGISHATEAETGTGLVTANSVNSTKGAATLPPTTANTIYEIWGMGDALQATFPCLVKLLFSTTASGATHPSISFVCGTTTDGAGNFTGTTITPIAQTTSATFSASTFGCWLSGSTNRINLVMFPNAAGTAVFKFYFSIERSHDSSGNDTAAYFTGIGITTTATNTTVVSQQSMSATQATQNETRLAADATHNTTTSAFGNSVLLCPVSPLVGAQGNPCINTLIGKVADFTDGAQFSYTLYGTSRTYQVTSSANWNTANLLLYDATPTVVVVFRYD